MPFSDITVPEGDSLTAYINPATRDIAVNMNSVASLSGDLFSNEAVLDRIPTEFVNMGFTDKPSTYPGTNPRFDP